MPGGLVWGCIQPGLFQGKWLEFLLLNMPNEQCTRASQRGGLSFIPSAFCFETGRRLSLNHATVIKNGLNSAYSVSSPCPPPPLPFYVQMPPDIINVLIRKWGQEFLFANKQISLCIWVAPPLLPLSSAAGEAGRKFSMKQRRHAARWLTSGAQGHRCWLEKENTLFDWSLHFHSKFREVKQPDKSKYSSFIPVDNATSILGGNGLNKEHQTWTEQEWS